MLNTHQWWFLSKCPGSNPGKLVWSELKRVEHVQNSKCWPMFINLVFDIPVASKIVKWLIVWWTCDLFSFYYHQIELSPNLPLKKSLNLMPWNLHSCSLEDEPPLFFNSRSSNQAKMWTRQTPYLIIYWADSLPGYICAPKRINHFTFSDYVTYMYC